MRCVGQGQFRAVGKEMCELQAQMKTQPYSTGILQFIIGNDEFVLSFPVSLCCPPRPIPYSPYPSICRTPSVVNVQMKVELGPILFSDKPN
jgi:hypothetical protein